jgi:peptide/nickel transport system ATP-binding protein
MAVQPALLEVADLRTSFRTPAGLVRAVDGVTFSLRRGTSLGIAGESGSGKSVLVRSIVKLYATDGSVVRSGQIKLGGRDIADLSERHMEGVRGREIGMVFQDPMSSLNPVKRIGVQIAEVAQRHLGFNAKQARARALELIVSVGLSAPERRLDQYPMQLSGGMRQRVAIAIALAGDPKLLIADEPTTALDVTVQAQILELLVKLQAERQMSVLLITHDLGVLANHSDRTIVMYAGRVVEEGPTRHLVTHPRMRYTEALIRSAPDLRHPPHTRLASIPGFPPSLVAPPPGCRFEPRCAYARERCGQEAPTLRRADDGNHTFACWYPAGSEAPGQ